MSILELKIYQPYFISNSTRIQYSSVRNKYASKLFSEKLSLMEIVEEHFLQKKPLTRLFFKVNLTDDVELNNPTLYNLNQNNKQTVDETKKNCFND